jgi:pyruvate dehydrogenase E2 component (dihydrolipoamide acetyltransferase)
MPKWGLEMREGTLTQWLVAEGVEIRVGTPIADVETDKISNAVEAPDAGILRRRVAREGELLPVKALLAVLAPSHVSDAEIDAFIAAFEVPSSSDDGDGEVNPYRTDVITGITVRSTHRGAQTGALPAVLLHGFGGDLNNWLFNMDAIGADRPVVAFDLPGHGGSALELPGASVAELSGFLEQCLAAWGIDRAHLVGHSLGGAIATHFAIEYPDKVSSLTLLNAAGLGDEIASAYINGIVRAQGRRDLKPTLEMLFADPSLVSRQMVDDVLRYLRLDGVQSLLGNLAAGVFPDGQQAATPGRRLDATRTPTLILWGAKDQIVPAFHFANAPGGASVHMWDDAGHMVMMEKASEVNGLVGAHLRAND